MQQNEFPKQFFHLKSKKGVLLIHGFSGSNNDLQGIGEYLFQKGYTVLGIILAGHGTSEYEMEKTGAKEWENSVREGYALLSETCTEIYVVGFSMGALLGLQLTLNKEVKAMAAVSPALLEPNILVPFIPIIHYFKRWYKISGGSDQSAIKPPYKINSYMRVPTKTIPHLFSLIHFIRQEGKKITIPLLILQGKKDGIIPTKAGKELLELVSSSTKSIIYFPESGHSLLLEQEREKAWEDIFTFFSEIENL